MNIIQLLYMDDIHYDDLFKKINKLYNSKSYMDRYGIDIWIACILCIVFFIAISYFQVMNNVQPIKADWSVQKCNPAVIPFAGLINNTSTTQTNSEFTTSNFSGCIQSIVSSLAAYALQPLDAILNLITTEFSSLLDSINGIRDEFDSVRNSVGGISDEIMGKALNVTMPLVQTTIVGKDIGAKAVGGVAATIYAFFGSFMGVQSLAAFILQIMLDMVIGLGAAIIPLIVASVFFPPALILLATDVVMMTVALVFYLILQTIAKDVFNMSTPNPPKVPNACFSKDTIVKLKNNGTKCIHNLKPGDILYDNSKVTSFMKLSTYGQDIYNLNGIIVTGNHSIFHEELGWINVENHPEACYIEDFRESFIYCVNTDTKIIKIGNLTFSDWDDLDDSDLNELRVICSHNLPLPNDFTRKDIHKYLNNGFHKDMQVDLEDGRSLSIANIEVNDTLRFGERVVGIVKIDAKEIDICEYHLEDLSPIKCTKNILFLDTDLGNMNTFNMDGINPCKERYIYHLLTDTGNFTINGHKFGDYNTGIEKYLSGYGLTYSSSSI